MARLPLRDPGSKPHGAWLEAASALRGVCAYCAKAYGVHDALAEAGVPMLADDHGHASLCGLLVEGRRMVTF